MPLHMLLQIVTSNTLPGAAASSNLPHNIYLEPPSPPPSPPFLPYFSCAMMTSGDVSHPLGFPHSTFASAPKHQILPSSLCRHSYLHERQHQGQSTRTNHMYASPSFGKPRVSLDSLSAELLALVFDQLLQTDRQSLWAARLTSRRAAAVATPILYRILEFNQALVSPDAARRYPKLYEHIQCYTREAVITSDLDPVGIRRVIAWTSRLSSIRWRYQNTSGNPAITGRHLREALDISKLQESGTELLIDDLPLQELAAIRHEDVLVRSIPAAMLVSLRLGHPKPPLTLRIAPLKRLLVQATRLRTLHYEDRGQGTSFTFDGSERMPAVEDLMLRSYDWDHSRKDVARHWDFSRIKSLQLVHVPTFRFLTSIDPNDLRNLHTLRMEDFSAHLPDRRREATRALSDLVSSYITSLEVLDLVCHLPYFSIDAVLEHRHTLQVLRLRDHTGFGEEDNACPTVHGRDLARLARGMPLLHTLELDMDARQCDPREFLGAACSFGNLHTLTVHVQTLLRPLDEVETGNDRDFEAAMQTFRFLMEEREKLNRTQHRRYTPWRRITINVGGWRKVMVRRVSSAWRERNERGIFAERCFVLERSVQGQVGVREEIGVESPSRRATPEL